MVKCPKLSWRDPFKMIVPIGWGLASWGATISYGATKHAGPAVYAFLSGVMCFFLAADIFKYHRTYAYMAMKSEHGKNKYTVWKFIVAIAITFGFGVATVVLFAFRARFAVFGYSDGIWAASTSIVSGIWTLDLWFFHLKLDYKEEMENLPKADGEENEPTSTSENL